MDGLMISYPTHSTNYKITFICGGFW